MSDSSKSNQFSERRGRFQTESIDGQDFKDLAEAALTWLRTNCEIINNLNVFPVPDGDTGTNMVLTMQSAVDEIADSSEKNLGRITHDLAQGALMGARGNSGVILSQLLRGLARGLDEEPILTLTNLAKAFEEARDTAYRGVVRPVEGTILTVAKDMAEVAQKAPGMTDDPVTMLEMILDEGEKSVERTPDLLPVLKDADVVDAGGKGLLIILEGMLRYINEQPLDEAGAAVKPLSLMNLESTIDAIEPGQDYEVIVDFRPNQSLDLKKFYADLEEMGTSIQVGEGDGMYRMHIHVPTEKRYEPIDYTMDLGTITKVYMENLIDQMSEMEERSRSSLNLTPVEPGQIAVIAVAPGSGIARVFASLGAAGVVEGGQTMNPSTQELLHSFENLPTDKVILLPNNKNIVMAAKSAAELTVKRVEVVPSLSVPQGLAAMLASNPDGEFDDVVGVMMEALGEVETGEITTATRSVEIDGVNVKEGEIIALHNGKLVLAASSLWEGVKSFLSHAEAEDYELITLFYGADVSPSEANQIADKIREVYPEQEVEVQEGGQPHYQFIFSIE